MPKFHLLCFALGAVAGACDTVETSALQQDGVNLQGVNLQGVNLQGVNLQGMSLLGVRVDGATLSGTPLGNVHVSRGELVAKLMKSAQSSAATLHGSDLVGAQLIADVGDPIADPPASSVVQYRIAGVEAEDPRYDPTGTGHTYLYDLEQWDTDTAAWEPACGPDADGRNAAIPLAAIWNAHGDRVESTTQFTFACTTGVIAKCYRWGYRPWVNGYGDLTTMHEICTRLARADYCGDGTPHTRNGTSINVWDTLPPPGPIQRHGTPPVGMVFEAGWNTSGAVCLSRARWLQDDAAVLAKLCPDRLVPPGLGETVCDTVSAALGFGGDARMFDEAYLNLDLGSGILGL